MKTKNQQPYFPHDPNTRNKDKIIRMRIVHGVAGYGVYFMLLERLRSDEYFEADLDYDVLAYDFDCDKDLIKSVINDFGLFEIIDEGRKFHSVELSQQMQAMLEAKQRRSEAARKAAEARWGKLPGTDVPVVLYSDNADSCATGQKTLFDFSNLDNEIQLLRNDEEWCKAILKEYNLPEGYLDDNFWEKYRNNCVCNGQKNGHRNIMDAASHCRFYIGKLIASKDVTEKISQRNSSASSNKSEEKLLKAVAISNRQIEKDASERRKMSKAAQSGDNVFRNLGYDPADCSMPQLFDPEWRNANPPTHPEWVGLFPGRETVEEIMATFEPAGL